MPRWRSVQPARTAEGRTRASILPSVKNGTDRTIRLRDGRRLGYAEWGDPGGRPLLYFHGWPGSRLEGRLGDEAARARGVRLIALDRPGMGLSDYQPRRTLVDWPDDVIQVAAALGLDRFAVLGISGGGPFAAACAWKLSEQLTGAGIVSCLAPVDVPGVIAGMGRRNQLSFQLVGRLAVLRRALFAAMAVSVRRRPARVLERGVGAAPQSQVHLGRHVVGQAPQHRGKLIRPGVGAQEPACQAQHRKPGRCRRQYPRDEWRCRVAEDPHGKVQPLLGGCRIRRGHAPLQLHLDARKPAPGGRRAASASAARSGTP